MIRKISLLSYNLFYRNKKNIFLIIILYTLIKFFYLNYINWDSGYLCSGYGGIQYASDSNRYIYGAESLINNQDIIGFRKAFIGYISIIALGKLLGLGLIFTILFQIIIILLSSIALFNLIKSITKSDTAGIIGFSFYLTNPFIVNWVLYIHSESIYSSMLVLFAWAINNAIHKSNFYNYCLSIFITLFTCSLRPNGWLLIPVAIIFLLLYSKLSKTIKYSLITSSLIIFIIIINYSPWFSNNSETEKINELLLNGTIICSPDTYCLEMPKANFTDENILYFSALYILKHPLKFIELGGLRIASELLPIYRPWLSNEFIIRFFLWMLPLYLFTLAAILFIRKNLGLKIVMCVIALHLLILSLTFSEREFRFLIHILPLLCVTGSCGLYIVFKKYFFPYIKSYN